VFRQGVLVAVLLSGGAAAVSTAMDRDTTAVPGVKTVILKDVHPLFGGQNVYLKQDGSGIAQLVVPRPTPPGLHERRFRLGPDPAVMRRIAEAVRDHGLLEMSLPDHPGLPNEAKTTIAIELTSGRSHRVSKWANDKHAGFEAVYQLLLRRAQEGEHAHPSYQSNYDPHWTPDG
jgi:hypothetical protein